MDHVSAIDILSIKFVELLLLVSDHCSAAELLFCRTVASLSNFSKSVAPQKIANFLQTTTAAVHQRVEVEQDWGLAGGWVGQHAEPDRVIALDSS